MGEGAGGLVLTLRPFFSGLFGVVQQQIFCFLSLSPQLIWYLPTALPAGKPYFVPAKLPESQHNSVQVVPALNTTVQINMTHLASEIHRYLEAW